jgi:hypothetical protein
VGAIVSVGDGHGPVGEGVGVEVGEGEGVGVGPGEVGEGEGVGVGPGEVGEGEGLSVGAQVSVGGDVVSVGVGSLCATALPPKEKPKAAVAASTARTQARRLAAIAGRRAADTLRGCGSITDPSSVRSRSSTLSRLPGHPQGPPYDPARNEPGRRSERPTNRVPSRTARRLLVLGRRFSRAGEGASPPPLRDVPVARRAARRPRS